MRPWRVVAAALIAGCAASVVGTGAKAQDVPAREIAVVVRVSMPAVFDAGGAVTGRAERNALRLTSRLAALHRDEVSAAPIALSVSGVLCDELRLLDTPQARGLLRELRRHARTSPVLAGSYANVRMSDLEPADVERELSDAEDAIRSCTQAQPRSVFVPADLSLPDAEILEPLRETGAVVALSAFAVPPALERPTIVPAVAFDPNEKVGQLLDARPETPSLAVVIDASTTNVEAVLEDLLDDDRFALRNVSALAKLDVVRGVIDTATEVPVRFRRSVKRASEALAQLRTFTRADNRTTAIYRTVLARARSSADHNDYVEGRSHADELADTITRELDVVSVSEGTVTFTSSRGSIPVTIASRAKYPVRLRIKLSSPKLTFPTDDERVVDIEPPGDTITFDAVARSTGTFPVSVIVTSQFGELVLEEAELTVRSTAANVSAVVLTAGGALFLVVWLARRLRSRRAGTETA